MKRALVFAALLVIVSCLAVACGETDGNGDGSYVPEDIIDKLPSMLLTQADLPPATPRGPLSLEGMPSSQEYVVTVRQVAEDLARAPVAQEWGDLEADDHCFIVDTVALYDSPRRAQEALEHTTAAQQGTITRRGNFTLGDSSQGPFGILAVHFRVDAVLAHLWVTSRGSCYSQDQVLDLARKMEQRIRQALGQ